MTSHSCVVRRSRKWPLLTATARFKALTASILLASLCCVASEAEEIEWQEMIDVRLARGVRLYQGSRSFPKLNAYYIDVDLNHKVLSLKPLLFDDKRTVAEHLAGTDIVAAINGGYFGGNASYSTVISSGKVRAINVKSVTRNGAALPVLRSALCLYRDRKPRIQWVYHFNQGSNGLFTFDSPLTYRRNSKSPQPTPLMEKGERTTKLWGAIGGGPRLVRSDKIEISYDEEVFWDSGVTFDKPDPRTAVGITADNHAILLVVDGRQPHLSSGLSLPELASTMRILGCRDAMNLDGGGSSQLATPDGFVNSPSELRAVPAILAVTSQESHNH